MVKKRNGSFLKEMTENFVLSGSNIRSLFKVKQSRENLQKLNNVFQVIFFFISETFHQIFYRIVYRFSQVRTAGGRKHQKK